MLVSLALLVALTASGLAQESEKDLADFRAILTECKITNASTMSWGDIIQCKPLVERAFLGTQCNRDGVAGLSLKEVEKCKERFLGALPFEVRPDSNGLFPLDNFQKADSHGDADGIVTLEEWNEWRKTQIEA